MADDITQFQAGRTAAIEGKPRDKRRSQDWLEGWVSVANSLSRRQECDNENGPENEVAASTGPNQTARMLRNG
jgi:hypothetical protein